ncbi:ankyrin repeat and SOCS box protein 3 isoform 1-T2 [Pholidichthys leucotaenia]
MDFTESYADTVSTVSAAVRMGRNNLMKQFIINGHSVASRDNRGWNALHESAAHGCKRSVKIILSSLSGTRSDKLAYVNSTTHEGETPCFLAAKTGNLGAIELLVEAGANIDRCTNDDSCAVFVAVSNGHQNVVELLVNKGADVNNKYTHRRWTCLHEAVDKDHTNIVRFLVNKCDVEMEDDNRITALFLAAQYGRIECLAILIYAGAKVNAKAIDLATPLMIATQGGHEACVDILLAHGANPNMRCSIEWTQLAIHAAIQFGHISILRKLIAATHRKCDRAKHMVSPMYMAVFHDQAECVRILLSEGYSADGQNCSRALGFTTPLCAGFGSATQQCTESMKLLIAAGATLVEEVWMHALHGCTTLLLVEILKHRYIPETQSSSHAAPQHDGKMPLNQREMKALLYAVQEQIRHSRVWISMLVKAGLDPSLLLQGYMFEVAPPETLGYLLEFINLSTLPQEFRNALEYRRAQGSWDHHYDSIPSLFHLCRLQLKSVVGLWTLMNTDFVEQLPIPELLHDFITFRDIKHPK